ncbi:MAG: HpcH/HpaI aldolase/citrate lyase family protein [Burkholderiales bacterium]
MDILVRRSNLVVPLSDAEAVKNAPRHGADAVTLVPGGRSDNAAIKQAIEAAGKGAAEVFVRVEKASWRADLEVAVSRGLRGIMLCGVEAASDVQQAAEVMTLLERERGIEPQSLALVMMLESSRAVWHVRSILTASPRVSQVGIDEVALAKDLGIEPLADLDPFVYARGRLAFEATAARVQPVGMSYPLSVKLRDAPPDEIHAAATKARNSGMKGVICLHAAWVGPVNAAFTPTPELVAWNRRVREAFAAGVAAGTAAVPLDGKMIDVPVDEWAIVVLAMAEACAKRDAQKAAARA